CFAISRLLNTAVENFSTSNQSAVLRSRSRRSLKVVRLLVRIRMVIDERVRALRSSAMVPLKSENVPRTREIPIQAPENSVGEWGDRRPNRSRPSSSDLAAGAVLAVFPPFRTRAAGAVVTSETRTAAASSDESQGRRMADMAGDLRADR